MLIELYVNFFYNLFKPFKMNTNYYKLYTVTIYTQCKFHHVVRNAALAAFISSDDFLPRVIPFTGNIFDRHAVLAVGGQSVNFSWFFRSQIYTVRFNYAFVVTWFQHNFSFTKVSYETVFYFWNLSVEICFL